MTDRDIKALLGKAVEGEPPLRIDRDEVFRTGRRQLRRRRFAEVGGVAASVVVAVVGAVVLIGGAGQDPDQVPPATSSTTAAPPDSKEPGYTEEFPPPGADISGHAQTLTEAFFAADLLPAGVETEPKPGEPDHPFFFKSGGIYHLEADLVSKDGSGVLYVEISPVPVGTEVTCDDVQLQEAEGCTTTKVDGIDVIVIQKARGDGEWSIYAIAVHQDGTKVNAYLSNGRRDGSRPKSKPPLSDGEVLRIVTSPELVWG